MKIVTVEEMRKLETDTVRAGISLDTLMEEAGFNVALKSKQIIETKKDPSVLVIVGSGNNGSDGLVAARYLHEWGIRVHIYICGVRKQPDQKLKLLENQGVESITSSEDNGYETLKHFLSTSTIIIDAILGIGSNRSIKGSIKEILGCVKKAREVNPAKIVAIDTPTGLDANTGIVDPSCVGASTTIALGYPKIGHFTLPGASVTGEIHIAKIGIYPNLDRDIKLELINSDLIQQLLPSRPLGSHKGTFGKLLNIVGSLSYPGAAALACNAAYRVGVGLVTLATSNAVRKIIGPSIVETTHLPLQEDNGILTRKTASVLKESLKDYNAILVGCGLSQEPDIVTFIQSLFTERPPLKLPITIDADALNILSGLDSWWKQLPPSTVLTPHPKEMARLTGTSVEQVQVSRIKATQDAARLWGKVVVLKGAFTIIASPKGTTRLSPFANPALASAGTGDVLAGVISGLLAQGLSPLDAATCGVYLHGVAGEELRKQFGNAGVIATDLLPQIPKQMKMLRNFKETYNVIQ